MIERTQLFGPILALAAWTIAMLLLIAYRRVRAALAGHVALDDFAIGESARTPPAVTLANRNYMNLLELPVLFYVACIAAIALDAVTPVFVTIAWCYVAARIVHSLIHVSYNSVAHRFAAFATSNVLLSVLWVVLALRVMGG